MLETGWHALFSGKLPYVHALPRPSVQPVVAAVQGYFVSAETPVQMENKTTEEGKGTAFRTRGI